MFGTCTTQSSIVLFFFYFLLFFFLSCKLYLMTAFFVSSRFLAWFRILCTSVPQYFFYTPIGKFIILYVVIIGNSFWEQRFVSFWYISLRFKKFNYRDAWKKRIARSIRRKLWSRVDGLSIDAANSRTAPRVHPQKSRLIYGTHRGNQPETHTHAPKRITEKVSRCCSCN